MANTDQDDVPPLPASPHDKLVKWALGQPEHAASHLRSVIPPKLAARVVWASLELEPGSYVGSNMRYLHTDLLFSAKLADEDDRTVLFYLVEHQSTPDRLMAARMYGYTGQVLMSWIRRQKPAPTRVPAVIPLVLYDGELRWTSARDLVELVDLPDDLREACRPYLPNIRYMLHDLWREEDDELRGRSLSALALLVLLSLKHTRNAADLAKFLIEWRDLFPIIYAEPGGREALQFMMGYYLVVNQDVSVEDLERGLAPAFGDNFGEVREDLMTTGRQLIEKGKKLGRQEGRQEGRREVLQRLLDRKFGPLSADAVARLSAAAVEELDRWFDQLLAAATLDEVFEGA